MSEAVDHGPLLCPLNEKAEREAANGVEQLDYLTELVIRLGIVDIRESHLLQLQSIAVQGIYPCAGTYRDARTQIIISDSEHVPPEAAFVSSHVRELLDYVNETRNKLSALERAAYALWRLNWIHPFNGGNGRTSRCLAYLILCLDLGLMMPGIPTLPTLIYGRRQEYVAALKAADASQRAVASKDPASDAGKSRADLVVMTSYLQDLVMQQLASAVAKLSSCIR